MTKALLLLLMDAMTVSSNGKGRDRPSIDSVATVRPIFRKFHAVRTGGSVRHDMLASVAVGKRLLHRRLSSVVTVPMGDHRSSLQVVLGCQRLRGVIGSVGGGSGP